MAHEAVADQTIHPEETDTAAIQSAIDRINRSIDSVNSRKIRKIFFQAIPQIEPLKGQLKPIPPSPVPLPPPLPQPLSARIPLLSLNDGATYIEKLQAIRGLRNPGCLCYLLSSLMALFASPSFRRMLEQEENLFAQKLKSLFAALQQGGDPLTISSGPLQELHRDFQAFFPDLRRTGTQQDASEFLNPMLLNVCLRSPLQFSVIPTVERNRLSSAEAAPLLDSGELPPVEAMYIPSVDTPVDPTKIDYVTCMVKVNIPEQAPAFSLGRFFHGYTQQEHVEVDAILGAEANKRWLTDEKRAALRRAGGTSGELPPIPVTVRAHVVGSPPFLPVYIPRFLEDGGKNFTPVDTPYLMRVPTGEQKPTLYVLRSVVVHDGDKIQGGHYYTYIPDITVMNDQGIPSQWVQVSDDHPREVRTWDQVRDDMAVNGVLYLYDRVEFGAAT